MRLDELEIGKDAVVASVDSDDAALRQHILDMGLTPGTEVTMMKYAPMGDPWRSASATTSSRSVARTPRASSSSTCTMPTTSRARTPAARHRSPGVRRVRAPSPSGACECGGGGSAFACPRGQSELRQDHPFQPADGVQPARGKLPRRHGRPQGRPGQGLSQRHIIDLPDLLASPYTSEEVVSRRFILDERPTRSSTSSTPPTSSATSTSRSSSWNSTGPWSSRLT